VPRSSGVVSVKLDNESVGFSRKATVVVRHSRDQYAGRLSFQDTDPSSNGLVLDVPSPMQRVTPGSAKLRDRSSSREYSICTDYAVYNRNE
jgi:hypothetical protein